MNEKLNIQDLIDLLAEKHGMSKKNADSFVKEFFQLIEEALEKDKYVKIKGLGAFKLIDVESRESVNVNTGERFEIQGHTKVSFTPEPALKDIINKPFAHFETVVLNEGTVLEDTPVDSDSEEDEDTEQKVEDAVSEAVAVYQQVLRLHRQPVHRPVHGKERSIQDINLVDFLRRDNADAPCQRLPFYHFAQCVALLLGELLRIIQQFIAEILRQYHGGSINRSRKASASRFVASGLHTSGSHIR